MTRRRKQKRLIRGRMERTGERYSTARAVLRGRARIRVRDVASTCRAIVNKGGAVDGDRTGIVVTVRDPDRNTIRIMRLS